MVFDPRYLSLNATKVEAAFVSEVAALPAEVEATPAEVDALAALVEAAVAELEAAEALALAAAACAVASVGNLAVALLACLTLWFGGNAVATVSEVLSWKETSAPMARILQLLSGMLPDFGSISQASRVAAGEAVPWSAVGAAWLAVLPHLLVLLALGWWATARKEL